MENTALTFIENVSLQQVSAVMQKIAQFQTIVQSTLKKNHDYGVIPGTTKPTLLKPGAEKILTLMGMTSEYEITEKIQDYENGFFAFTIKCTLLRQSMKITEGLGHANTKESRYSKRWVSEKKIPEGIDKKSLQTREKDGKYGTYTEYLMTNDDPYTLANTVLKMAKKRAQVDAALTVASLSEIFTQDIEDQMLEEIAQYSAKPETIPVKEVVKAPQKPTSPVDVISVGQGKRLHAIGKKNEDIIRVVMKKYGYDSTKDIRTKDYEKICAEVESDVFAKEQQEAENVNLPWEEEEKE